MDTSPRFLKQAAPLAARRIPATVHDAHRSVRERVLEAEREARVLVASAEAERDRIRAEAAEEGHRAGVARAAALLAAAAAERDRLLASLRREVALLAIDVARKVLGEELSARPEAVEAIAARALREARGRAAVLLRLHPADAAALRGSEGRLGALLLRAPLLVREDAALARGDVVVETEAGRVDAAVETQLAALARALEEADR